MKKICLLWYLGIALSTLMCTVSCDKSDDETENKAYNNNDIVVDLGLKSGIKWAKTNVGATNPWEYGNYYAWGETETKTDYSWETYKYCKGSSNTLTKYCYDASLGDNGFTDTRSILETIDDVAISSLGTGYAIPTTDDWNELYSQCYWVWVSNYAGKNVSGYMVYKAKSNGDKGTIVNSEGTSLATYSNSDAHIFIPAAGYREESDVNNVNKCGYYWSATLNEKSPDSARDCYLTDNNVHPVFSSTRIRGLSIRPVRHK